MARVAYGHGYRTARAAILATGPLCAHCGRRPATRTDHQPPLSLHVHRPGTGCCVLVPSCYECERRQAAILAGDAARPVVPQAELVEPVGFARGDAVWDVPWLRNLRARVPADAVWPRLMTVPHPRAVDSLGADVARWVARRRGRRWRWWQRLVATRLLEVDDRGELVWEAALVTVSRQVGKTWWLGDLCSWRLEQGDRFGAEQLVLSTGKDVAVVREMQRPARVRAKQRRDLYRVREVNGQEEIELLADASRWMVRSREGVYGLSASMATVDEAWKVPAAAIDDGVIPTMVEQPQAQLLLVSTAHRRATALMIGRRATALDRLGDPESDATLIVEWSAPRIAALDDVAAWRQASPHWSAKRQRLIAQRLQAAITGESEDADEPDPIESFRTQWLNQWPARRVVTERGEPLVEPEVWEAAGCDDSAGFEAVIGIEDHHGRGAAVAVCADLADGRVLVAGRTFPSRAEAYGALVVELDEHPGAIVVAGAGLVADRELAAVGAVRAGAAETAAALSAWRDLLATGQLAHDRSPELSAQVSAARVVVGAAGLTLVPGERQDLLRAALWAARAQALTSTGGAATTIY